MKKLSAVVLLAGLFSAGVVVPAHAAGTADPAPTNVKISWKDETFQFVHVTWDEEGAQPNRIAVRRPGSTGTAPHRVLAADAPNEIDLPRDLVQQAGILLEVRVSVGTATEETSPFAASVPFDTIDAGQPVIQSYQPSGTSTLAVSWKQGTPDFKDTTPGDPLDRDLPVSYQPAYRGSGGAPVPIGQPTTNTSATVTGPTPPFSFVVQARNEWISISSQSVEARKTAFTASVPSWVVADQNTVIRGTYSGPESTRITLQARNSATSAWYAVVGYDFSGGSYEFTVPSRGTRTYRVAFGNTVSPFGPVVFFGGYSAPVTTTTQLKASVSLASPLVFRSSQPVPAWLTVTPAITGAAALQRWNGSAWVFITNVAISAGHGTGQLSAATAGTFTYRYYVPAHTFNGLGVAAAYSPNFTLTVKP